MARTYQSSDLPCDFCGERPGMLVITDARPLDCGDLGIIEANPGEPKLCDDCNTAWRVRRAYADNPAFAARVYCAANAADALRLLGVKDWQAKERHDSR